MNDVSHQEPSSGSLFVTVVAVVGGFLLFGALLYLAYLPTRESVSSTPAFSAADLKELNALAPAERAARERELRWERKIPTPDERKARLVEMRDHEAAALTDYSWIDRDKGIVRLPIQRAMELTIQEAGQGTAGAAR